MSKRGSDVPRRKWSPIRVLLAGHAAEEMAHEGEEFGAFFTLAADKWRRQPYARRDSLSLSPCRLPSGISPLEQPSFLFSQRNERVHSLGGRNESTRLDCPGGSRSLPILPVSAAVRDE